MNLLGSRNDDKILALSKNPRQRNLPRGSLVSRANFLELRYHVKDLRKVLLRIPGIKGLERKYLQA